MNTLIAKLLEDVDRADIAYREKLEEIARDLEKREV